MIRQDMTVRGSRFLMSSAVAQAPRMLASYDRFDRANWAQLRASTPLTLDEADLLRLRGINDAISLPEVEAIYLPLSRLLNLHVSATQELQRVRESFLGQGVRRATYIVAIAGSVAVGKSTSARILQALLSRWPNHPRVDLVTTDGFLHPNNVLTDRGLMDRKGFPESYDTRRLLEFVAGVKAGRPVLSVPTYSHLVYDIVPEQRQLVEVPDILIVEGLNVLQGGDTGSSYGQPVFVSDFFDFSIYVDASEELLEAWFLERFRRLRDTAFKDERSYFRRYAAIPEQQAMAHAARIWRNVNLKNLRENIAPTRERANIVLRKGAGHAIDAVWLRKN